MFFLSYTYNIQTANMLLLFAQDLGISKVGHMKRILQGTKELAKSAMVDLWSSRNPFPDEKWTFNRAALSGWAR